MNSGLTDILYQFDREYISDVRSDELGVSLRLHLGIGPAGEERSPGRAEASSSSEPGRRPQPARERIRQAKGGAACGEVKRLSRSGERGGDNPASCADESCCSTCATSR